MSSVIAHANVEIVKNLWGTAMWNENRKLTWEHNPKVGGGKSVLFNESLPSETQLH